MILDSNHKIHTTNANCISLSGYLIIVALDHNDDIKLFGSSADRSDLEISDEILQVNGKNLIDLDPTQIVAHIHSCIRERIITLKVKQSSDINELKLNDKIKEAYIIGVDEQAKKRLESLTETRKVTPISIDTLISTDKVNTQSAANRLITLIDPDDYFYDQYDDDDTSFTMVKQEQSAFKQIKNKLIAVGLDPNKRNKTTTSTPTSNKTTTNTNNDTLCLSSTSSSKSSSVFGTSTTTTTDDNKHNKILISNQVEFHTLENTLFNSTSSVVSTSTSSMSSPTNIEYDTTDLITYGSREMAIDCPDTFQGEVKTKPCYPPRLSLLTQQQQQHVTQTPFILHDTMESKVLLEIEASSSPIKYIDDNYQSNQASFNRNKSIKTKQFQEKQKFNREDSNQRKSKANDELILRNSLRNSEKLRKLVDHKRNSAPPPPPPTTTTTTTAASAADPLVLNLNGMVNSAFVNDDGSFGDHVDLDDEDEDSGKDSHPDNNNIDLDHAAILNGKFVWKDLNISDLFAQIDYIQKKLNNTTATSAANTDDLILLRKLYQTSEFQNALILYNKLTNATFNRHLQPQFDNCCELSEQLIDYLESERNGEFESMPLTDDSNELCRLLKKLNVKNILQTHDHVALGYADRMQLATGNSSKTSSQKSLRIACNPNDENALLLNKAEHYSVENLKLVHIDKLDAPLGATIRNQDGSIVIGRIVKGSVADLSGLLHEDDEILEINSIPIRGKTINDVSDMLATISGTISFLLIPQMDCLSTNETHKHKLIDIKHIRALFNYEPDEDLYMPCKELGLSFLKGDVLHIISEEDMDWWQAYKDGDKDQTLAGLIPSQDFQEKRFSQMQALIGDSFMNRNNRNKPLCYRPINKSKRRRMFESINETCLNDIVTYEEVVLYRPPSNQKRPIVLIGPHSIGRHELRKRLMQSNPSLYEVAVPHTTRAARRDEIDGKDYHFIARHIFEADIKQNRFVEHGEFEKNLYGTSKEAIRKVIGNSKICVLNLYPQALNTLRNSKLMPYVVYIGPPSLSKLKELKMNINESYKENDLLDVIDKGREIEELYGHYFDKIIRNTDMDKTYYELVETIDKVQNEEQWIPASWLQR